MKSVDNLDSGHDSSHRSSALSNNSALSMQEFDLQYLFEVLRKFKFFIVLSTILVTAAVAYYCFTAIPIYRSTATLLVESQKANVVSIEEIYSVDDSNLEYYQTQIELLRSRELASNTIESLELWDHPELQGAINEADEDELVEKDALANPQLSFVTEKWKKAASWVTRKFDQLVDKTNAVLGQDTSGSNDQEVVVQLTEEQQKILDDELEKSSDLRAIRNFTSRVIVEPVRKTKLIKVSYESSDPELAAAVANEIGKQYIASYLESKSEVTANASQWLSRRLTELKTRLSDSERRLRDFKRENGLVDVDGRVGRLDEQELLLLTTELSQAKSQLSSTSNLYNELKKFRDTPELLEGVAAIQADPLIRGIKIDEGRAQRVLDELLNRYGSKHPRVVDAESQLASLKASFTANVDRIVNSIGNDYALIQQRVANIEGKLDAGKQEIQELGSKKFQLDALEREAATNQKLYDIFFSRYTEAGSASGLEQPNARMSEAAIPSPSPIRPRKSLITAMAALGALALSIFVAFLIDKLDDTVKSARDVEKKIGLRLLGVLPTVKRRRRLKKTPLNPIGNADKAGAFAEAVNASRTALCFGKRSENYNVILITSSVPGEGKTTTSVNLAYSFGQQEKVLVIDGDMRRPSVGNALGMNASFPGLSDLIQGTALPNQCIKRGVLGNSFDVLLAGTIPDHPLELLTTRRFESLLGQLSNFYDRIIIDSAPVHAVTDALVFSKFADAVVYVIKSHDTSVALVNRGLDRLLQVDAKIVGCLVTQADMKKLASYGGDMHYSGYFDRYGYTEKQKEVRKRRKHGKRRRHTDDEIADFSDFIHIGESRIRSIGGEFASKRDSNGTKRTNKDVEYMR